MSVVSAEKKIPERRAKLPCVAPWPTHVEKPNPKIFNKLARNALTDDAQWQARPPKLIEKINKDLDWVGQVIAHTPNKTFYPLLAFFNNASIAAARPQRREGRRIVPYFTPNAQQTDHIGRGKILKANMRSSINSYGANSPAHDVRKALSYRPFPHSAAIAGSYPVWGMESPTFALRQLLYDQPLFNYRGNDNPHRADITEF